MARWRIMSRMRQNCRWRCRTTAIPTAMCRSAMSGRGASTRVEWLEAQLDQTVIQIRHRFRRRAWIVIELRFVAQITDIGHAFGQGIEAGQHEPAQPRKELCWLFIARLHLVPERDGVEYQTALRITGRNEIHAEAPSRFPIQPRKTRNDKGSVLLLL